MENEIRPNYVLDTISLKIQAHALRESKQRTNCTNHWVNRQKATTITVKTQHGNSWRQEKFMTWSGRLNIFPFYWGRYSIRSDEERSLYKYFTCLWVCQYVPAWILLIASVSFMLDHLVMANGHWRAHNLHARQTHSGSAAHNSKPKTDS